MVIYGPEYLERARVSYGVSLILRDKEARGDPADGAKPELSQPRGCHHGPVHHHHAQSPPPQRPPAANRVAHTPTQRPPAVAIHRCTDPPGTTDPATPRQPESAAAGCCSA